MPKWGCPENKAGYRVNLTENRGKGGENHCTYLFACGVFAFFQIEMFCKNRTCLFTLNYWKKIKYGALN